MTASRIFQAWRAGFTRRWHTNADLSDTDDFNHGHQGRVALLMVMLKPDVSRAALIRAISHDLGEHKYGDFAYDFKQAEPGMARRLNELEQREIDRLGIPREDMPRSEYDLLKLCDWLDAYLWMAKHRPRLAKRGDWLDQQERMLAMAAHLGMGLEVDALMTMALAA